MKFAFFIIELKVYFYYRTFKSDSLPYERPNNQMDNNYQMVADEEELINLDKLKIYSSEKYSTKDLFVILLITITTFYVMILLFVSTSLQNGAQQAASLVRDSDFLVPTETVHVPAWRQMLSLGITVAVGSFGGKMGEYYGQSPLVK